MKRNTFVPLIGVGLILQTACTAPLLAQAVPISAAPFGSQNLVVPERTEIDVELMEDLKSGANRVGEEVPFKVANDVFGADHTLLVPAGTAAYGTVTKSSRRGMLGKAGKLEFTCDYVFMPNSVHVPLRSDPMGKSGQNNGGAVIASVLFLSVFAVFVNGRDVTVSKGKTFPMYVNSATEITRVTSDNSNQIPSPRTAIQAAPAVDRSTNPGPADHSAATVVPGKSLFTMNSGAQVVGTILSFDGKNYQLQTDDGTQTVAAEDVKSVYALAAK